MYELLFGFFGWVSCFFKGRCHPTDKHSDVKPVTAFATEGKISVSCSWHFTGPPW